MRVLTSLVLLFAFGACESSGEGNGGGEGDGSGGSQSASGGAGARGGNANGGVGGLGGTGASSGRGGTGGNGAASGVGGSNAGASAEAGSSSEGGAPSCPLEPMRDASCVGSAGLRCEYDTPCGSIECECMEAQLRFFCTSCQPSDDGGAACPPYPGGSCPGQEGLLCRYDEPCGPVDCACENRVGEGNPMFTCRGCEDSPCPFNPPPAGTPCAEIGLMCSYEYDCTLTCACERGTNQPNPAFSCGLCE